MQSGNVTVRNDESRSFWHPLQSLQSDIDRLFNQFTPRFWAEQGAGNGVSNFLATMDVAETGDSFNVSIDVPGMTDKDIEITLSDGVLQIKGERKSEREEKKADYHLIERSFGSFNRRLQLPCDVDEANVKASVVKGVLNIQLPKSAKAKSAERKIPIKTE